jgi:hypothetical protein
MDIFNIHYLFVLPLFSSGSPCFMFVVGRPVERCLSVTHGKETAQAIG